MKTALKLALLTVLATIPAAAQNSNFQTILLGSTGRPLAGATVTVCSNGATGIPCSPTVNIYADQIGTPKSNPFTTDGLGNLNFWAPAGTYVYSVTGTGTTPTLYTVVLPCIVGSACVQSGLVPYTNVAYSPTPSFNASYNASYSMTLTGNASPTITGTPVNGNILRFQFTQDATGNRTVTFPSNFVIPPFWTLALGPNAITYAAFVYDGANWNFWNGSPVLTSVLPNTPVTFNASLTFPTTSSASYSVTLTGNVTSSTFSGTPINGNLVSLTLTQDATGGRTFAFPANAVLPPGYTFDTAATHINALTFKFDGTNWNLVSNAGTGGGGAGCTVAGNLGDVQINASPNCGAGKINDNGTIAGFLSVTRPQANRGPAPAVDVTAPPFFVRAVNPNVPPLCNITVSASSTSATAASCSASPFQINDGIAIPGAGTLQSGMNSAPPAPTVVPACASSATGTGYVVPTCATGSTTYNYVFSWETKGGGFTPASPAGTTTTGNAALGAGTTSLTSVTNLNGTETWTVTSTANLGVGSYFRVQGTTDDQEFGGFKRVASIVDGTHFTSTGSNDSRLGMNNTTATGGTVYYWLCNQITLPTPPSNALRAWIWGRTSGSYALLHVTYPINLGFSDSTYLTWDDFGATMQAAASVTLPWWAPASPPVSAQPDMLVTQITNISGATYTLANAAVTGVSTMPSRYDMAYGVNSAKTTTYCASAAGCGGTINFPAIPEDTNNDSVYMSSSYIDLGNAPLNIGGTLQLGDTIANPGAINGTNQAGFRTGYAAFPIGGYPVINVNGAYPGLWIQPGGANVSNVNISAKGNDYLGVFETGASGPNSVTFTNVTFTSNLASNDYMGVLFYSYSAATVAGFGGHFFNTAWESGPNQVIGSTTTPLFISKYNTEWKWTYEGGTKRGFYFVPPNPGLWVDFSQNQESQGMITPLITVNKDAAGNAGGVVYIHVGINDTGADTFFTNHSTGGGSFSGQLILDGVNAPGSGMPLTSGNPFASILVTSSPFQNINQIGQNQKVQFLNQGQSGSQFPGVMGAPTFYLSQSTAAPTAGAGCTWMDVYNIDFPSFVCNNSTTNYITASLPSTVTWAAGQALVATSTPNVYTLSNSGTPCTTSPLSVQYNNSGTFGCVTNPATPANVSSVLTMTPSTGDIPTAPIATLPGVVPRVTVCPSNLDTVLPTDRLKTIYWNDASACAVTLPQAGTGAGTDNDFTHNFSFTGCDLGAGTVTLTPTISTLTTVKGGNVLSGQTSVTLSQSQCAFLYSDNINYYFQVYSAGGVTTVSNSDGTLTISPTSGNAVASINLAHANTWSATQSFPAGSIPNATLANSSVTVGGAVCTLGSSCSPVPGTLTIPNAASTGTTVNTLTKLTGIGTAVIAAGTDTGGIIGICTSNCTTSGNATIQLSGSASLVFDGATVANDYVCISTTGGDGHDCGSNFLAAFLGGQVIGRVLSTNGAGGTYAIDEFPQEINGLGLTQSFISTTASVSVNSNVFGAYYNNQDATAAAAITYTLPTAVAGKQLCFTNSYNGSAATTGTLELLTSAAGQFIIFTDGTLSATGGYVISAGAAADSACVVGVDSTHWQLYTQRGSWTKH